MRRRANAILHNTLSRQHNSAQRVNLQRTVALMQFCKTRCRANEINWKLH